jgi:hypothetical protein
MCGGIDAIDGGGSGLIDRKLADPRPVIICNGVNDEQRHSP